MDLPREEMESLQSVMREFAPLTNEEAYSHLFKRIMEPVPERPSEFYGCDQRIDLAPSLNRLVRQLPQNAQVFDVGAGAGDVVDFALQHAPDGTVVNLEEPNSLMIQEYVEKIKKYDNLKQGVVYVDKLQDLYQTRGLPPQHLILAIHMIYHLTDFASPAIDPEKDIIDAVSFLYKQLAPGGSIFLVFASNPDGRALECLAEKYFRTFHPQEPYADHLLSIFDARNKLLGPEGTIVEELLLRFPDTTPQLKSELRKTYFFSRTIADMAAMALAGELCPPLGGVFNDSDHCTP